MFSPGEGDNCTEKLVTRFLGLGDLSVMTKSSKKNEDLKPDPQRGDAILKRMLQTKPSYRDASAASFFLTHGGAGRELALTNWSA
jgi:hypothetical protein